MGRFRDNPQKAEALLQQLQAPLMERGMLDRIPGNAAR
jgi:hypothetical protein